MSIKVTVNQYLNVRVGKPSVNAPCYNYLSPGSVIEVEEGLVTGDNYDGNNKWYKGLDGSYYWSGGVTVQSTPALNSGPAPADYAKAYPNLTNWNIGVNNIPNEWIATKGQGVKVAVLDTGIFLGHEDLTDAVIGADPAENINDTIGHGTHMAGIIGARSKYAHGIIGVAPSCQLIIKRVVFDVTNVANNDTILINALDSAVQQGADIINMSFDYKNPSNQLMEKIIDITTNQKVMIVAAAGDNADILYDTLFFPARLNGVISVATINQGFFDRNPEYNKTVNIISQFKDFPSTSISPGLYCSLWGSSPSTAFMSGIIALYLSFKRNGSGERFLKSDILTALAAYSTPIGEINYNDASKYYYNILSKQ